VTRVLDTLIAELDAGGDLLRQRAGVHQPVFLARCLKRGIELIHLQPGQPRQNARAEVFKEDCAKSVSG